MDSERRETSNETPGVAVTERPLRTPAHGAGKLMVGGKNRGGPGVPKSEVRQACQLAFAERVERLKELAAGRCVVRRVPLQRALVEVLRAAAAEVGRRMTKVEAKELAKVVADGLAPALEGGGVVQPAVEHRDQIRAMDLLGKYGIGAVKESQITEHRRMELVLVDEGPAARQVEEARGLLGAAKPFVTPQLQQQIDAFLSFYGDSGGR